MMLRVISEDGRFDYAAAAFDPPGMTFRDEMLDSYKAQRQKTPVDVTEQVPLCRQMTEKLGIPALMAPGYEADDVLGTLSRQASELGMETVILSSDKDLLQLVDSHTTVRTAHRDAAGAATIYDYAKVVRDFGFEPIRMIDYKALCGDSSDNLPGVPGIGPKTARELISQYGGLDAILGAVGTMPAGRAKAALAGRENEVKISRDMVTIVRDVPGVMLELSACRVGVYDRRAVEQLMDDLGIGGLKRNLPQEMTPPALDNDEIDISQLDIDDLIGLAG